MSGGFLWFNGRKEEADISILALYTARQVRDDCTGLHLELVFWWGAVQRGGLKDDPMSGNVVD